MTRRSGAAIGRMMLAIGATVVVSMFFGPAVHAVEYGTPHALNLGDVYRIDPDGHTGDMETTQPKTDANDGAAGDNPYFQRTNVARAHNITCPSYWYTSADQVDGEPDPAASQYVDYVPPFGLNGLPPGGYRIIAQYRADASRALYGVDYIITHAGGTTTITHVQADAIQSCATVDLGIYDLGSTGFVRVSDPGTGSVAFASMRFEYAFPADHTPAVSAGPDQKIILPRTASLSGKAGDDGTPGPLTTTWSMVSGPGTVTFENASAPVTTATFSTSGLYVLRLTASDTATTVSDDLTVEVLSTAIYSTQYEFDADPSTAAGVIDADANDANGAGLLSKAGNGATGTGGGLDGGVFHFLDNTSSGNYGYYWAQTTAADISYTVDLRVKVLQGVSGTTNRRSMAFSGGPSKNLGVRLTKVRDGTSSSCTAGSVVFAAGTGGVGEGCVDLSSTYRRLRVTVNALTNTLRIFDLDGGTQLISASGVGGGTLSWATEINGKGGFQIGSISGSATTLTEFELDYFRVLLGTAIEDPNTIIQSLISCGSSVSPGAVQTATAMLPALADPGQFAYTIGNSGTTAMNYTVQEVDQNGEPADYPWLALDKSGGTLAPNGQDGVIATLNSAGLAAGIYNGYIKFVDGCTPTPNTHVRQITLTVYDTQFDVTPSCNIVRSYMPDYPATLPGSAALAVVNPGTSAINYSVTEVDQAGVATDHTWLTLSKTAGSVGGGGSDTITATIDTTGVAAGTYDGYLRFATTNLFSPNITRRIILTVMPSGSAKVYEYQGDLDPLTVGFGIRAEAPMPVSQGAVEDDAAASDGKAWRIQDTGTAKTKFVTTPSPWMSGGIGATVVGRLRVRAATTPYFGGLFMWESPSISAECHWGGPSGLVLDPNRNRQVTLTEGADDAYHIIRMTAFGLDDCNRVVRVYFDENPVPALEIVNATAQGNTPEGFGFGAGGTSGTYDIAFDWLTATNAGAFAPGEEEAVIGRKLVLSTSLQCADLDADGDLDEADFAGLQRCISIGTSVLSDIRCKCYDRNNDGQVDEFDINKFTECASGPGIPWSPVLPDCP